MYLLDELDFHRKNNGKGGHEFEFEILTRIHLTGVLDLGCAQMRFWEIPLGGIDDKAERSAYLKTISYTSQGEATPKEKIPQKKDQYYIPGGIPNEIIILMTLFTRAHFVLSRSIKQNGLTIMRKFPGGHEVAHTQIDGQTIALDKIKLFFDMLEGLRLRESQESERGGKCRRLEPFMLSARLYHLALSIMEKDESLAYVTLVSAVESLLHDYDLGNITLSDYNTKVASLLRDVAVAQPEKYKEIENALLSPLPLIKQRFKRFIGDYLTEHFWNDPTRPKETWKQFKDIAQISEYVERIYNARSEHLHNGAPFPPSIERLNNEVPISEGITVGSKKEWTENELLPPFRAFERIVHHVLIEYLRRESEKGLETIKQRKLE